MHAKKTKRRRAGECFVMPLLHSEEWSEHFQIYYVYWLEMTVMYERNRKKNSKNLPDNKYCETWEKDVVKWNVRREDDGKKQQQQLYIESIWFYSIQYNSRRNAYGPKIKEIEKK